MFEWETHEREMLAALDGRREMLAALDAGRKTLDCRSGIFAAMPAGGGPITINTV